MLIEHTSGSIEDKPETEKMWWCVTAVNRMLQPAKSPWSANPACVTTTLKTATRSTQSQPQKSQRCPNGSNGSNTGNNDSNNNNTDSNGNNTGSNGNNTSSSFFSHV